MHTNAFFALDGRIYGAMFDDATTGKFLYCSTSTPEHTASRPCVDWRGPCCLVPQQRISMRDTVRESRMASPGDDGRVDNPKASTRNREHASGSADTSAVNRDSRLSMDVIEWPTPTKFVVSTRA
ncbi:uncharacterized protein N7459_009346 [Penicillium hispanicum]|uniref:uncharacterized protein n=1 Tax=Penicillium hispanicum TaxID=1080232 RepID=UPI0025425B1A|nr:uncharacterized protein N7459_009346 [Penicillium hispanicum]KAJ5569916.1 hypothetical protein N7459_009346 [Penicillium hispanicum]